MVSDDVRGARLRPHRPKGALPTSDSAKQLLQKSLRRTLSAVSYEALPPQHFIRRPRNVLSDPPDELTAEVEDGHSTGALLALPVSYKEIQPEPNLHVIFYAEMPTLRHP
ncbi:hypothetical protein EVAR_15904_1 [Eumeta japonica]|uniref:Uncharacterized protein n=1 Tax=Eumeta variegata TaxID=151549 RepID=A0A4C1UEA3_EUMVA|nr:hypothetical protein EVAR_15904_1 [Eumeta japonica]